MLSPIVRGLRLFTQYCATFKEGHFSAAEQQVEVNSQVDQTLAGVKRSSDKLDKKAVRMSAGTSNGGGQGRGRPRVRPFLQMAARRMAGGFSVGQDVIVRWIDGLFYRGEVLRVDEGNDRCQVLFEDKSTYYVLFKDIHSVPADEDEPSCCTCQGDTSEAANKIVLCESCGMGYHQNCHHPPIAGSALLPSVGFLCKLCTFATRMKNPRSSRPAVADRYPNTEESTVTLPYKMNLLTWDAQHKTNVEQCYCYCGGPGEWHCKMLQCCRCRQWFHEACVWCLREPLLYGDRFLMFVCSLCNHGHEYVRRLPFKWVDVVHLALFNLTMDHVHKYYDLDAHLLPWIADEASNLQIDNLLDGRAVGSAEVRSKVESALNGHKSKFVSGREVKKKGTLWALVSRTPPHPPSIIVPVSGFVNEEVMENLNGRGRKVKFISPAQCQTPVMSKSMSRCRLDQTLSIMFQCQNKKGKQETNNNRLLNGFSPNQCYNGYSGLHGFSRSNGSSFHATDADMSSSEEEDDPPLSRKKSAVRRLRGPGRPPRSDSGDDNVSIKKEPKKNIPESVPAEKDKGKSVQAHVPQVSETTCPSPQPSTAAPVSEVDLCRRTPQGKFGLLDSLIVRPPHFEGQHHPFKTDIEKEADLCRIKHFESRVAHLRKEYATELAAIKISENFKQERSPSKDKSSSPGKSAQVSPDSKRQHQQRGTKRKLSTDTDSSQDSVRRSKRSRQNAERYQHLLASFPRHMPQKEKDGTGSRWKWLSVVDQLRYGEKFEILSRRITPQGQVQFLLHWKRNNSE